MTEHRDRHRPDHAGRPAHHRWRAGRGAALVVTVASKCASSAVTPFWSRWRRKITASGRTVIVGPCNQFICQAPGNGREILTFLHRRNYGDDVPLLARRGCQRSTGIPPLVRRADPYPHDGGAAGRRAREFREVLLRTRWRRWQRFRPVRTVRRGQRDVIAADRIDCPSGRELLSLSDQNSEF